MNIRLILVPYDSGAHGQRLGRGPFHFVENGAVDRLQGLGLNVDQVEIESDEPFLMENGTSFDLMRKVSEQVTRALADGAFPMILSGNCDTTVGTISGYRHNDDIGLIWFDAHADFKTPETTVTGFLDGMGMAMLTDRCWRLMTRSIPNFKPLSEKHVIQVGARDFNSDLEKNDLLASDIAWVQWDNIRQKGPTRCLADAWQPWVERVNGVYVHIDMDVHDAKLAPANLYKPLGGLTPAEMQDCVLAIADRFKIIGTSITAFDPDSDEGAKGLKTGLNLIAQLGELARRQTECR